MRKCQMLNKNVIIFMFYVVLDFLDFHLSSLREKIIFNILAKKANVVCHTFKQLRNNKRE